MQEGWVYEEMIIPKSSDEHNLKDQLFDSEKGKTSAVVSISTYFTNKSRRMAERRPTSCQVIWATHGVSPPNLAAQYLVNKGHWSKTKNRKRTA